jgi:hypothetical protein
MYKKAFVISVLFLYSATYAQVGGQAVYQFLSLSTSPRQAAMGGKVLTFYDDDVNQAHFNPAAINAEMDNHLAVNYGSFFGEVSYGTAAYAYTFEKSRQTIFAGTNYINYGQFDGYDEYGNKTGQFTGSEAALSLGYGYTVPESKLHFGVTGKLITSALEQYTSTGGALDLGMLYIHEKNGVHWAFTVRNLGTQFKTYSGLKEKLPMEVLIGISQTLENVPVRWNLTLENLQQWNIAFANPNRAVGSIDGTTEPEKVSVINNVFRHVIFGAELFPKRSFNLRLGYNFRRGEELSVIDQRSFAGLSLGFGLNVKQLKFNYAYSRYTLAGNTSLFGVSINLNE